MPWSNRGSSSPLARRVGVIGLAVALTATGAMEAAGQRLGPEPKRKRAAFVSDTNDAAALYNWGREQLERDPQGAADAFYWAARLNPGHAEARYGRRAALLLREPGLLNQQMNRGRRGPSKELQRLDSLLLGALTINPFLYQRFDRALLVTFIRNDMMRGASMSDAAATNPGALDFAIETYMRSAGPEWQGWMAYSEGNFGRALDLYGAVERAARNKASIRIDRARIFGMRGEVDSAVALFQSALTELRAKEAKEIVYLYNSKAMLEHSIATLLEGRDDVVGAREAYGRALQEDLAFYPSHVRLGMLSLSKGDTTTALSELELAAQAAPGEPSVHLSYGFALLAAKQTDAGIAELEKAVALEPLYAAPHALLGQAWEQKQDAAKAVTAYEAFLARAARSDPQRSAIASRLADVRTFVKPQ